MSIEHTKTAENLRKALAGESIARNKYTYFAQAAQANGDEEVAAAFEQMAKNEMMHAKFWFELLYGKPEDTKQSLTQAALGEYNEWSDMYPAFAAQARGAVTLFSRKGALENGVCLRDKTVMCHGRPVLAVDDILLPGLHNLENYMAAIEAFDNALSQADKIGANEVDICYYKAAAQFAAGDLTNSVGTYDTLLEYDNANSDAYFLRGCVYLNMSESGKAQEDFAKAVKFASDDDIYLDIYNSLSGAGYEEESIWKRPSKKSLGKKPGTIR